MLILEGLLLGITVVVLVPALLVIIEVLAALMHRPGSESDVALSRPRVAVLIPAHNESAVIAATVDGLLQQLEAGDELLVVADNCTDDTASLAASAGARVIEREDREKIGKGHALHFGMKHLEPTPPDVVAIIDADCEAVPGAISRLSSLCAASGNPVQSCYLLRAPEDSGLNLRIAELAVVLKNLVRPLGARVFGMPSQLTGSGMAIPWELVFSVNFATSDIVEDLKIGVEYTKIGHPVQFDPDSRVNSVFPSSDAAAKTQRTRWEHGHLNMIATEFPRTALVAVRRRDYHLLWLCMDMAVPPLSLLIMLLLGLLVAGAVAALTLDIYSPLASASAVSLIFTFTLLIVWYRWGRQTISLRELLQLPVYVLSKLGIYLRFIKRRETKWIRTDRD
jgi:cellulose synthase/poly-beta-1,6-N-acetylglucosamine synthase-like glycosyltransferase